jgi:pilus assembly protein CpaC
MVKGKLVLQLIIVIAVFFCCCNITFANGVNDSAQHKTILLTMHKGKVIRLPQKPLTVFLADPNIADLHIKSPGVIYLYPKRLGETSLYAADKYDRTIVDYTIRVQADLWRLKKMLSDMFDVKNLHIEMLDNKILIKGDVESLKKASEVERLAANFAGGSANVLNFTQVAAAAQISLRVQIVEMSRDVSRAIGINWSAFYNTRNVIAGLGFGSNKLATLGGLYGLANIRSGNFSIDTLINVLESNGLVTILSQPTLTTLSGETASFLAGGEVAIPIAQALGTASVAYKTFGVSLSFTPTLMSDDLINLKVNPEVSELSSSGGVTINRYAVPGIVTRRAQTTVELKSGQSFVIAGLLQNNAHKYVDKFPGLGDLPIIGNLFSSEHFQRGETELVIIVTPYLVRPTIDEKIVKPIPESGEQYGFMLQ